MIHIEFGPSTFVGVGLTVVGILLYLIRTKKPIVSRGVAYNVFGSWCLKTHYKNRHTVSTSFNVRKMKLDIVLSNYHFTSFTDYGLMIDID